MYQYYQSSSESQICSRCVMDVSDPNIKFSEDGLCNHCINFDSLIAPEWKKSNDDGVAVENLSSVIRNSSSRNDFDCIIGLSGGLDSSFAALVAVENMGLKPLLFHVDAGWNTERAVGNIEKLVDGLGLDLYTEVVDWNDIRRMQVAFFRSGIPDQDLVQDAVFFSCLYKYAFKHGIKHVITGSNFSTECCREPEAWGGYIGIDKLLFKDVWAKCGDGKPIQNFPIVDILTYKVLYQKILGMKVHHPLNLVQYNKQHAEQTLAERFGFEAFQHKHHESRFTRFFEDYWLIRRFGFDKRRAHFSSLIMTGQMKRSVALKRLASSEMDERFLENEFAYVAEKLELSKAELQVLFDSPLKTFRDFNNKRNIIMKGANVMRLLGLEKRLFS